MSGGIKCFLCSIIILLGGCNDGDVIVDDDIAGEVDTGVGETENDSDDLVVPDPSVSYLIPSESILRTELIARELRDGMDLDDVSVSYDNNFQFLLSNNTPRTLVHPVVQMGDVFYTIEKTVEAFSTITVRSPVSISDAAILFYEETPFFRVKINSFNTNTNDDTTLDATAVQIESFTKEIVGYRVVNNYFSYVNHATTFLLKRAGLLPALSTKENRISNKSYDCGFDHSTPMLRYSDSDSATEKLFSLLNHKPNSHYEARYVDGLVYGMATVGNGWLSVVDKVLYKKGQITPNDIYLHEKHHNHGFNHSGGMTYGWPDKSEAYIRKADYSFFENPGLLATPLVTKQNARLLPDGTVQIDIRWFHKDKDKEQTLNNFLFISGNKMVINEIGYVNQDGSTTSVDFDNQFDNQLITISEDKIHIKTTHFDEINSLEMPIGLYINASRPLESKYELLMLAGDDDKVHGNLKIDLSFLGVEDEDGKRVVFIEREGQKTEEGKYVDEEQLYLPEEAKLYCESKGLELGILDAYKSSALMSFQHKYLPYSSMVGISPEKGTPVAILSTSSYKPNASNYTDKGSLIVCAKPD
ncbi:outer membrane lipoprotein carrier protein LolA [Vibrio sp. DW001]|uniref:hypothetical protein n=1 Tax=Vibrio sp. DW001 TaxID=2912315 RepID=UPI0023B05256|nr:hypothetical protein [Vibrio sp. DW001]WED27912.1 outer membrane lipoprotein carrier protein LolA [Vibrio sp. DW001]